MSKYFRFRGDLFSINYNSEQSGTIISETDDNISLNGIFRTAGDFGAVIWSSEDYIKNKYIAYNTDYDYSNVKLNFNAEFKGFVIPYSDLSQPSLTINHTSGEISYVTLGFCSSTSTGNATMRWTGANGVLGQNWIKWGSVEATWYKDGKQGKCLEYRDYKVDYVKGLVYVCGGNKVPFDAEVKLEFEYSDFKNYIIDFDNIYQGLNPKEGKKVNVTNIKDIRFPLIPKNYNNGSGLIANEVERDYSISFNNITVTNGYLNDENPFLENNGYSIAEDYDNIYSYCPRRMAKEMNKLGYSGIVDLYIGASHFYCKNGQANQLVTNYKDMTLNPDKGINSTFKSWLASYCKNLKENNVNEIVISVSLENLQMPESWKQRLFNGIAGQTGWQPPTCFYSLTNENVRVYIEKISTECLNIVDEQGLNKIFQFGEPWWWAQAFAPGNVSEVNTAQPLAIYDEETQNKFKIDNGFDMPIYETSIFKMNNESKIVASWLNLQLQDYSNFMKGIALKNGAEFAVLYYPPSTLSDTVPEFVKKVNTPFNAWNDNQLNYLQLEDYGWVTGDNPQHQEVYTFGEDVLGYSTNRQQYFAGFVDDPSRADVEWPLIWEAAKEAKEKGFANVFIWSGTQVREGNVAETNTTDDGEAISTMYEEIIKEFGFTESNRLSDGSYAKAVGIANGQFELGMVTDILSTDKGALTNSILILGGEAIQLTTGIDALTIPFGKDVLKNIVKTLDNGLIGIEIKERRMSISVTKIEEGLEADTTLTVDIYLVEQGISTVEDSWQGVLDFYSEKIVANYTVGEKIEIIGEAVCAIILGIGMVASFGTESLLIIGAVSEGSLEEASQEGLEESVATEFGEVGKYTELVESMRDEFANDLKEAKDKFKPIIKELLDNGKITNKNTMNKLCVVRDVTDINSDEKVAFGGSGQYFNNPTIFTNNGTEIKIDKILFPNQTLESDALKAEFTEQSEKTLTDQWVRIVYGRNYNYYVKRNITLDDILDEFKLLRDKIQRVKNLATELNIYGNPSLQEDWNIENCAEIWAYRNGLLLGIKGENIAMRCVFYSNLKYAEPCFNCMETFATEINEGRDLLGK